MASNEDRSSPSCDASDLTSQAAENATGQNMLSDFRITDLLDAAKLLLAQATKHPAPLRQEYNVLLGELKKVVSGTSDLAPEPGDKRFADPVWKENKLYSTMLAELFGPRFFPEKTTPARAGLEAKEGRPRDIPAVAGQRCAGADQFLGGQSRRAETSGRDKRQEPAGTASRIFLATLPRAGPFPSQVDGRSFKVGENLAVTPGHVVLRTEMFELLQYSPQTEQARQRPILVIPSIINKYYAFDLAPGRSLCEYIVKQGFTLFTMVWRNPQTAHDHWGMDAYMDAMDAAIGAVHDITGIEDPSVFRGLRRGAAPGLARRLLHGARTAQDRQPGADGISIGYEGYGAGQGHRRLHGPRGHQDHQARPERTTVSAPTNSRCYFALLRPNDLIWNYWINNYLMGNQPPAFDVLYWKRGRHRHDRAVQQGFLGLLGCQSARHTPER